MCAFVLIDMYMNMEVRVHCQVSSSVCVVLFVYTGSLVNLELINAVMLPGQKASGILFSP